MRFFYMFFFRFYIFTLSIVYPFMQPVATLASVGDIYYRRGRSEGEPIFIRLDKLM